MKLAIIAGLLLISVLALGFTHSFISSAQAGGGCDQSGSPDETVTCTDTSDGDLTTGNGNDSVSVDNSDVGNIDTGNGDDSIQSSGPNYGNDNVFTGNDGEGLSTIGNINAGEGNNTLDIQSSIVGNDLIFGNDTIGDQGIQVGSGNNSITIDYSAVEGILGGDGNNTVNIENGAAVGVTTLGNGDNQVNVTDRSTLYVIGTGSGNDSVAFDQQSGAFIVFTGAGDDTVNSSGLNLEILTGDGNDHVTIDGNNPYNTIIPTSGLDGGNDYDILTFKFTVGSQKEKDSFNSLVSGDASSGTVTFGGHSYYWQNFEELNFLLKLAHASGSDDVSVAVLGDSRLNNRDMAAPIALYCKAGQIEGWVIDPATGNGTQQFAAPISAFPTSSNGVDGSISGDQATVSYAGYSYSFPVAICP